ncbi:p21-activated protein kinase-interacting protein 1-like [Harpegnathos saltator]|uniref:p21-activated protein kinase-interacting protein 1-like n=1 Tax=Harpegnathos saltator TaxID=610380 RepID=E2BED9_HARSA|nr:p21-activated protein kinase-interacting protein 1-like [Harpegnathos saltator]XP_011137263.1 p21-activated protein kinase-interacting protein 1-like [Harpegnathos saltator]EFN85984.1 p21-activated protein kinase-interacting protein 1-like [Harpegnathos saltator]
MPYMDSRVTDPFEIIVGTYEQYLLGYKVQNIVNEYKVEKSFATHSHVASIRSVTSSKNYLASAGADDIVCLYDLRNRKETGKLMFHNDTINCLAFTPEASHLFTCSNDGSIAAVRCGNWQIEKHWQKAHKGLAVNTLAIHPTGKLALSTGMDGALRTWNLVKGRQAYAINLIPRMKYNAKNITIIRWNPNGDKYLLAINQEIYVYFVETAGVHSEFTFESKIVCVEFLNDNMIAAGFENGQIKFCDLRTKSPTLEMTAHDIRVKCIANINNLLVSASSSGEIKLWKYSEHNLNMLQSVNCGARITCLALALTYGNLVQPKQEELEKEKKVKKESTLRLKQEVIIEDEGETEVVDIASPKIKTKHKNKRVIENLEDDVQDLKKKASKSKEIVITKKKKRKRDKSFEKEEDVIDKPRKKMLLKTNEPKISNKKRQKDNTVSEDIFPTKKVKKTNIMEQLPTSCIKRKEKLSMTMDTLSEDGPPRKKRKKKIFSQEEVVPKNKRKGHTHTMKKIRKIKIN